jgi:hypothetical protein
MKPALAYREDFGEGPSAGPSSGSPSAERSSSSSHAPTDDAASIRQLNEAIDVVASLSEQASRLAGRGSSEQEMAETFEATFSYMVEYLRHLTAVNDPQLALARAATLTDLTREELEFLGSYVKNLR